jgi:hypothetical protein
VPGWCALYYRLTIPETPRYTFDVLYDVEKASLDARRYRYGKSGNAVNPVEQARVRRDMVSNFSMLGAYICMRELIPDTEPLFL